ncbi:hypothetical protein WG922_00830 [Ramlibacter sp. AN1015]|uniref:hypothetical protein n=1 Tax=Ramlibacter sp. AN1015 TaxID=3133428 RepID=UPI0030C39908
MFTAWMIGFLLAMAAMVWVAVVLGVPQPYIGLVVFAFVALGVIAAAVAFKRARRRQR